MAAWLAKNGPISIGINANAMQVSSLKSICAPEAWIQLIFVWAGGENLTLSLSLKFEISLLVE